jgi:histone-lysine N-methyltransferase SETD3
MDYLQRAISFNHLCSHDSSRSEANDKANFLSLECAFGWLQMDYRREHDAVMKLIAKDQEEPLPLNWAAVIEDWDRTYWIVWILLLWMLWLRNPDEFKAGYLNDLWGWQSGWYS